MPNSEVTIRVRDAAPQTGLWTGVEKDRWPGWQVLRFVAIKRRGYCFVACIEGTHDLLPRQCFLLSYKSHFIS